MSISRTSVISPFRKGKPWFSESSHQDQRCMATEKEISAFMAARDIAAVFVTGARSYTNILIALEDEADFQVIKQDALSSALLCAQVQAGGLEALPALKRAIDSSYHPPLLAILGLSSIASSLLLVASAASRESLEGGELLTLGTLRRMISSPPVDAWLKACLGESKELSM